MALIFFGSCNRLYKNMCGNIDKKKIAFVLGGSRRIDLLSMHFFVTCVTGPRLWHLVAAAIAWGCGAYVHT